MKRIIYLPVLAMACLLAGCEDFPDEYGYLLEFDNPIVVEKETPGEDGCSLDLSHTFTILEGTPDVLEVGFTCTDTHINYPGALDGTTIRGTVHVPYYTSIRLIPYLRTPTETMMGWQSANFYYSR